MKLKLTSKGRYTITAILDVVNNSNGNAVRLVDISNRQKISLHYLEQLFRKLRQGGVVKSVRGPGGGYILSKTPNLITVGDVLDSIGESSRGADTPTDDATSEVKNTLYFYEKLSNSVVNTLKDTTLDSIC